MEYEVIRTKEMEIKNGGSKNEDIRTRQVKSGGMVSAFKQSLEMQTELAEFSAKKIAQDDNVIVKSKRNDYELYKRFRHGGVREIKLI